MSGQRDRNTRDESYEARDSDYNHARNLHRSAARRPADRTRHVSAPGQSMAHDLPQTVTDAGG